MNAPVENLPARRELAAGGSVRAIVPQTMEDAYRLASAVVKAGMAPRDMNSPEKCLIAIMQGMEVGLKPLQAIQRIAVINGRPTIWGDAAMGLVRASGACEYVREWTEGKGDDYTAFCKAKRRDEDEPIVGQFSVGDAKRAKLWGKNGPWTEYPRRMLQMRARSFALRDGFADVLGGLYVAEELGYDDSMRDVTPQELETSEPPRPRAAVAPPPSPPPADDEPEPADDFPGDFPESDGAAEVAAGDGDPEPWPFQPLRGTQSVLATGEAWHERFKGVLEAQSAAKAVSELWRQNAAMLDRLDRAEPELFEELRGIASEKGASV
ncbi:recombinase RecT [Marinibaculum pumilum]|uniref:Recombinase RecT n=1 Tax=Marinibaculum pumilum TaxID=1766165 RepID=A0ABV7KYI8_9PROT